MNPSDNQNYYEKILENIIRCSEMNQTSVYPMTVDFNGKTFKLIKDKKGGQAIPNRLIALALKEHKKDLEAIKYENSEDKNGYERLKSFFELKEPSWFKRMGAKIRVALGLMKCRGKEEKYLEKLIPPKTIDEVISEKTSAPFHLYYNLNFKLSDNSRSKLSIEIQGKEMKGIRQLSIDNQNISLSDLTEKFISKNPNLEKYELTYYVDNEVLDPSRTVEAATMDGEKVLGVYFSEPTATFNVKLMQAGNITRVNMKFDLKDLKGKTFRELDALVKQKNPSLENYKLSYAIGGKQYKPDTVISEKNLLKPDLANLKITLTQK